MSYLKGQAQEYHENGFIEKYPVAVENFPSYSPTPVYGSGRETDEYGLSDEADRALSGK